MRKITVLLSTIAGLGLSQAASAADLGATKVYTKAPPPAVSYGWTGSYVGGYIGGAFNDGNTRTSDPLGALPSANYNTGSTFIGGVTTGYNYQFSPNWLVGYEGDTGYQEFKGSGFYPGSATQSASTTSNGWFSSLTGRFGYVNGPSLIYAKGGATLTRFDSTVADPTTALLFDRKKWVVGYAVGGGWEYMLGNKWSVKAEYLYLGFGDNISPGGPASTSLGGIHTARVGLNYKWDPLSLLFYR
ncbi:MAG: outer membrane beta-barrel protein [Xanthobacteraceae bacterium]|nr:outer membrane beta-barrel protein [Xanthobacteraceae bacterium]